MNLKILAAAAVAAAFAFPAMAADDKAKASAGATKADGGAEAMFKALDKNKDGNLSRDEVKGTPHDKDFATLDKNKDGKLTRQEHASAPEHAAKKGAAAGATAAPANEKEKAKTK